jgi:broad specificity phosphatase PhoE
MPRLLLLRHAQPDFTGNYDSITALGEHQAIWAGEHFAMRGLRFARMVSGSLVRQRRTLEIICARLESAPGLLVDAGFNEYDPTSVLAAAGTLDEAGLRARGDRRAYFMALRSALRNWSRHASLPDGAESWVDFGSRAHAAVARACADLEPTDDVLVVTSGGVIGRLVADALDAGADAAIELNLQTRNTGITELVRGRTASRLLSFNAVPHLERPDRAHAISHS